MNIDAIIILLMAVHAIDPEAAVWLETNIYTTSAIDRLPLSFNDEPDISMAFAWSDTPQGNRYWWNIETLINPLF